MAVHSRKTILQFAFPALAVVVVLSSCIWLNVVLNRPHKLAKRAVDYANLRGIGQAWRGYCDDYHSAPADLSALISAGLISESQLQDPDDKCLSNFCDYYIVDMAEWMPEGRRDAISASWPIAWCDPKYHDNEGGTILFVDGHGEFRKQPGFDQTIATFKKEYEAKFDKPPKIVPPR